MAKWCRIASNLLLIMSLTCGVAGAVLATGWLNRPARLTVTAPMIELGDVASGDIVPLAFTLHNDSRAPIRLVGAAEE